VRSRDRAAWEQLGTLYGLSFRRTASKLVSPSFREDAVNEFWLKAFRLAPKYDPRFPTYPWLSRICARVCLDCRRGFRRFFRPLEDEDSVAAPERAPGSQEPVVRAPLRAALASLPSRQREVVTLRFLFEVPMNEIAELIGCSKSSASHFLARGIESLRERLLEAEARRPRAPVRGTLK
jgi:RNA polymerase sigma-70 factor (ECF subfamily)